MTITHTYKCPKCLTTGRIASNLAVLPCKCVIDDEVQELKDRIAQARKEMNNG